MTEREAIVAWLRGEYAFDLVYPLRYDDDCGAGDITEILARAIERGQHLENKDG